MTNCVENHVEAVFDVTQFGMKPTLSDSSWLPLWSFMESHGVSCLLQYLGGNQKRRGWMELIYVQYLFFVSCGQIALFA